MMKLRDEYPRPHFRRDEWLSLNGLWEFEFDDNKDGELRGLHTGNVTLNSKINVPFTYQYEESGIGVKEDHDTLWYRRSFECCKLDKNIILGFNGSDYITNVWVNGYHTITHRGGFAPFTIDITKYLNLGTNTIVVKCYDPFDPTIPRGKQSWLGYPFSCWYVANSGIWQSVWLDYVGEDSILDFSIIPNIDNNSFSGEIKTLNGLADMVEFKVFYDGKIVKRQLFSTDGKYTRYTVNMMELNYIDEVTYWAPEHPNLFYVDIILFKENKILDIVHTRFGMRKISVNEHGHILLNNKPLYQRLILDQGYWPNSGLTPPGILDLANDVKLIKQMGFNGARKHQKFEDPYYYWYADEMGLLTWCEMPSAYNFNSDEVYYQSLEWQEIIKVASHFTSVITYVPLNESWGVRKILNDPSQQNYARSLYYLTKSIDGSRLVSTNDGWENIADTDILSIHDYRLVSDKFNELYNKDTFDYQYQTFRKVLVEGDKYSGQPVILSEFGGIAFENDHHDGNWGYNGAVKDEEEFLKRLSTLMNGIFASSFEGYCYTQLTDVQQEVNGLLDANHCPKVNVDRLRKIFTNEE